MAFEEGGLEEHEAGVAVDRAGTIYYFYTARNRLPYLVTSKNGGEVWSKPLMVGPPGIERGKLANDSTLAPTGRSPSGYVGSTNATGGAAPDGEGDEYTRKVTWNGYVTDNHEC